MKTIKDGLLGILIIWGIIAVLASIAGLFVSIIFFIFDLSSHPWILLTIFLISCFGFSMGALGEA